LIHKLKYFFFKYLSSLRNEFDIDSLPINSLHGASTQEQAEKELKRLFPMEQTIALLKPGLKPEETEEIEKKIVESGFIIATKKSEKLSEDIAKEIYKGSNEKEYFGDLVQLMTRFFLVLIMNDTFFALKLIFFSIAEKQKY
jgi:nucleoside diphosphate kinase